VADTNHNPILPNSRIGINFSSYRYSTNLLSMNHSWMWNENLDDLGTAWKEMSYIEPPTWGGPASGFFYALPGQGTPPVFPCGSANPTPLGGYANWTYYFRTHFSFPSTFPREGFLIFTNLIDDGAIFYLNGTEIWRHNTPNGLVRAVDPALGSINNATCIVTNVSVTNLLAGDNVLAVEVHQFETAGSALDVVFGTTVDFDAPLTSPLPPKLAISKDDLGNQILSWSNAGDLNWGLEFTTEILNTNTLWTPLTNISPYTNSSGGSRIFRLRVQ